MKTLKKNAFIVSCQAEEGEPLYGKEPIVKLAIAAEAGGADAIRALSPENIREIKKFVNLPVIGITKNRSLKGAFITTTKKDIDDLVEAHSDFIAIDCTRRERPEPLPELFDYLKKYYPHVGIIADIADIEDVKYVLPLKPDYIATTLAGYTDYTSGGNLPDLDLIEKIVKITNIPVIAEGNISTPQFARQAILCGAHAVTVGSAITRPHIIAKNFKDHLKDFGNDEISAVGIDIGGTWTRGVLIDRFGEIIKSKKVPTAAAGKEVISNMLPLIKDLKTDETHFIGIATGGKIDFKSGIVNFSTGLIPDWEGVQIADIVEQEFHIRPKVDNDANCAAYFQYYTTKVNNLLMITVGTGLGGGIISNGKIIRGIMGGAGEIGHIVYPGNNKRCTCGKVGCVETLLSGRYLKEEVYEKNNEKSLKNIKDYAKVMAWLIDTVKTTVDFEKCYLGGVIPKYGEKVLKEIRSSYKEIRNESGDFIEFSQLGEFAGARGSAILSFQKGEI